MPPLGSDDEISDSDIEEVEMTIPKRDKGKGKDVEELESGDELNDIKGSGGVQDDDNDEDAEDGDEDEYVVEAILQHLVDEEGSIKFLVKWEGYEKEEEKTWEPEENLIENKLLDVYYDSVGGRDSVLNEGGKPKPTKKRVRKSNVADSADTKPNGKKSKKDHPASSTPPASSAKAKWVPPTGSWEEDIESIDAIEEVDGKRLVYVQWNDGRLSQHETKAIYKHCPQKMLRFYESHLQVTPATCPLEASVDVLMHRIFKPGGGTLQELKQE